MSLAAPVERRLTAFLPDQEDLDQDNPIHANSVAREQGFKAALIPGPTLFGWTVPAVRDALGDRWLHDGWADIRYRRPVYPGDPLIVRVAPPADSSKSDAGNADGACELRVANAAGDLVTVGQVGLGRASWYAELKRPIRIDIQPPREPRLPLTPDNIPRGRDLPARRLHISPQQAADYARIVQGDDDSLWRPSQGTGSAQGLHPGWLALRGTETVRHTYRYGPSIQSRNQIQHLAPARPGEIICAGHMADGYERKGRHYAVADVLVLGGAGVGQANDGHDAEALTHLRYSVIYQLAAK